MKGRLFLKIFKRILLGIALFCVAAFAVVWAADAIRCEDMTRRHAGELFDVCDNHNMIGPLEYIKVLAYENPYGISGYAKVYAVSENREVGVKFILIYEDKRWEILGWDTIWSAHGNADEIIWPYIR